MNSPDFSEAHHVSLVFPDPENPGKAYLLFNITLQGNAMTSGLDDFISVDLTPDIDWNRIASNFSAIDEIDWDGPARVKLNGTEYMLDYWIWKELEVRLFEFQVCEALGITTERQVH